jgi:hypothetical protein
MTHEGVAQSAEQRTVSPHVDGSSPSSLATTPEKSDTPAETILEVGVNVVHMPIARTEPCPACKRTYDLPRPESVERARQGKPMKLRCDCGAILVVQRRLVVPASKMPPVTGDADRVRGKLWGAR